MCVHCVFVCDSYCEIPSSVVKECVYVVSSPCSVFLCLQVNTTLVCSWRMNLICIFVCMFSVTLQKRTHEVCGWHSGKKIFFFSFLTTKGKRKKKCAGEIQQQNVMNAELHIFHQSKVLTVVSSINRIKPLFTVETC